MCEVARMRPGIGPLHRDSDASKNEHHASRVRLDIETNDIEAEVSRLEALGAKRVAQVKRWWIMEAPTGQRFCVVRPQRPDFEDRANVC